jgi:hypothetical protein
MEDIETKNKEVQVSTIFENFTEIPIRSNDRYKYNPELIVSQNIDFEQNEEIKKLHNEISNLRESMEMIRLEKVRQTMEELVQFQQNKENVDDNEEEFDHDQIEKLLKYREELDKEAENEVYKMPVYQDTPEKLSKRGLQLSDDSKVRNEVYMKKRFNELKN